MANETLILSPGAWIARGIDWLNTNAHWLFSGVGAVVETVLGAVEAVLLFPPAWGLIGVVVAAAFFAYGWRQALFALACLGLCLASGLWPQAMQTIALVTSRFRFPWRWPSRRASLPPVRAGPRPCCDRFWTSCKPCPPGST